MRYKETFAKRWPLLVDSHNQADFTTNLQNCLAPREVDTQSLISTGKFSATTASKLFEQEIRQVVSAVLYKCLALN